MAAVPASDSSAAAVSASGNVVDEETAREVFARYSKGGTTIEKGDVRDLAFDMGDVLSSDDVDKVFAELDSDGNGHIEFGEFYAWLTNPDRERSGNVTRMLHAQLMASTTARMLRNIISNGSSRKVKPEEGKTVVDVHVAAGEVGDDPAFSIEVSAGPTREDAPVPEDAKLAMAITLEFQDEGAAGAMQGFLEAVCSDANQVREDKGDGDDEDAPKLTCETTEIDGRPCVVLVMAFHAGEMAGVAEAAQAMLIEGPKEILEDGGDFSFPDFLQDISFKIAASMTPSDIIASDGAAVLSELAVDVRLQGALDVQGLLLLNAMLKNAADANFMMEDEYKGAGKACKVASSVSELTQVVKFRSLQALIGAFSKGAAEMMGQVPMKAVAMGPIAEIVHDVHKDEDTPDSVKDSYKGLREECSGIKRLQVWGAGMYGQVDLKGMSTDFLPTAEEAKEIEEAE